MILAALQCQEHQVARRAFRLRISAATIRLRRRKQLKSFLPFPMRSRAADETRLVNSVAAVWTTRWRRTGKAGPGATVGRIRTMQAAAAAGNRVHRTATDAQPGSNLAMRQLT